MDGTGAHDERQTQNRWESARVIELALIAFNPNGREDRSIVAFTRSPTLEVEEIKLLGRLEKDGSYVEPGIHEAPGGVREVYRAAGEELYNLVGSRNVVLHECEQTPNTYEFIPVEGMGLGWILDDRSLSAVAQSYHRAANQTTD